MRFGEVVALDGVSLSINPGVCIGLVGHNGAGKSTIVSVINGGLTTQGGEIYGEGALLSPYGIGIARSRGLRCMFQELSLCPNLSIVENARIVHRGLGVMGRRKPARAIIAASLDLVFPGHGIDVGGSVGALSIAQRQMVEIAMAFSDAGGQPPRLVILDEPTSSLDAGLAAQLLDHVRRFVAAGGAVILVSHMLNEILATASRIVVMKDGKIVAERPAAGFDHDSLVEAMGSTAPTRAARRRSVSGAAAVLEMALPRGLSFRAGKGEVVGLAGLGGHGQTRMLLDLFDAHSPQWWSRRDPEVTFVAGDRRENGIFEQWSIVCNMTAASLGDLSRRGLLQERAEAERGADWKSRIGIRTPDMNNPILSLSGGNQQKALFARALSTRAPVVLMDDPMSGVDVGTKSEVYGMIRAEAEAGRTFVWYSTEMEEMQLRDRVYVFRDGAIVVELTGEEINEYNILRASFEGAMA